MTSSDLKDLKGLGPKSQHALHQVGIFSRADLEQVGPIAAFKRLREQNAVKPSLNFLYAMVGALADTDWRTIAAEEKSSLLAQLDGYQEMLDAIGGD